MGKMARKMQRAKNQEWVKSYPGRPKSMQVNPTKIYLDDERQLPPEYKAEGGWVIARNAQEFWEKVYQIGWDNIEAMSFDNDLGLGRKEGHEVLNEVEREIREHGRECPPRLYVHTQNPARRKPMERTCLNLLRDYHW